MLRARRLLEALAQSVRVPARPGPPGGWGHGGAWWGSAALAAAGPGVLPGEGVFARRDRVLTVAQVEDHPGAGREAMRYM
ncbi:hypothetical protein ADK54_08695 [Streptomyces sp. WM6378]|nr:hypothetical protein ADK54_08695 [Streptomyces sp. WM6378]